MKKFIISTAFFFICTPNCASATASEDVPGHWHTKSMPCSSIVKLIRDMPKLSYDSEFHVESCYEADFKQVTNSPWVDDWYSCPVTWCKGEGKVWSDEKMIKWIRDTGRMTLNID